MKLRAGIYSTKMTVAESLDADRELQFVFDTDDQPDVWLSEAEVIQLRDHLNKIIAKEIEKVS